MTTPIFPVNPIASALTVDGVTDMCDRSLARAEGLADGIRKLAGQEALTWETTFGVFDDIVEAVQEAAALPVLMSVTHPDAVVRDAAKLCEPKADAFITKLFVDDAIAEVLTTFAKRTAGLPAAQGRFVEYVVREYRRNGLELGPEGRARLRELNERLTALGQDFDVALAETTLSLDVNLEQLKGLPQSYVDNHPASEDGRVRITTDYPDLVPVMRYAEDREMAERLYMLSESRGAEKTLPMLQEILKLREEKAHLLGYETWAEYILEPRMAKDVMTVRRFIDELHDGLVSKREEEVAILREAQRQLRPGSGDAIKASDAKYLEEYVRKERFSLDTQKLAEYFEKSRTQQGIMDIASRLYGITFTSVDVPVWHEDVEAFDVTNGKGVVGRIYLDLYPREGKYKHAAMFGLRDTRRLDDGSLKLPIGALVCNFPKPGKAPALMSHEDVTTFFHEFGHLLHHIMSESELASFAGTNVARDFVEVPSQMFEAWAWDREALNSFAAHYVTGERLPDEMFAAMTEARKFGQAIATERQLFFAAYDFACHTRSSDCDVEALTKEIYPMYSSFERVPGSRFPATFGHLIGYSAAYYSYQWALVIAFDVLTRFEDEGMFNTQTAGDYRTKILARGATDDEARLVEDFLGRPSTPDAYLRFLGIEKQTSAI